MSPTPDKCPFCDIDELGHEISGIDCLLRQLAAKDKEIKGLRAVVDKLRMADGKLAILESPEVWFYSNANSRAVPGIVMESDRTAHEFMASYEPNPDMAEPDSETLDKCHSTPEAAEAALHPQESK